MLNIGISSSSEMVVVIACFVLYQLLLTFEKKHLQLTMGLMPLHLYTIQKSWQTLKELNAVVER